MNAAEDRRKAGFFLLSAFAVLLVLVGTLVGFELNRRDKVYLVEFTESVSGLEPSSAVKYNGVPVGTVRSIRFRPDDIGRIQVEIGVHQEVPVKMDTRAQLKPQGITGIFFLELYGGTQGAGDMPEGDIIPTDLSIASSISGTAKNLSELVERLNQFFAKNEEDLSLAIRDFRVAASSIRGALEKVEDVVDGGKAALEEARGAIVDIRTEVKATGEALRDTVAGIDELLNDPALRGLPGKADAVLEEVRGKVGEIEIGPLIEEARAAIEDFRAIEDSLDRAARALADTAEAGREDVQVALANIRAATEHVKTATRRLKEDPSRLLRSPPVVSKPIPDPMPPSEDRP